MLPPLLNYYFQRHTYNSITCIHFQTKILVLLTCIMKELKNKSHNTNAQKVNQNCEQKFLNLLHQLSPYKYKIYIAEIHLHHCKYNSIRNPKFKLLNT